jgi:hypothetical protein
MNDALEASQEIKHMATVILDWLKRRANAQPVIALHVRAEADWLEHCVKWESIPDGIIRDNCLSNTKNLVHTLEYAGIQRGSMVYLAGGYQKLELRTNEYLSPLVDAFHIVTKEDVMPSLSVQQLLEMREFFAAIDYEICERVPVFVGNSVSTFSALLLASRERRRQLYGESLKHFHYNGAEIPLFDFLPLDGMRAIFRAHSYGCSSYCWPFTVPYLAREAWPLKWIFAYTSFTNDYADALKVAVLSAVANTRLRPICLFYGERNDVYDWLVQQGVDIIQHAPKWAGQLRAAQSKLKTNVNWSHLYESPERMIATFLRIDIPILGFPDDYVLYTGGSYI